jgi:predicted DCC family thiol-disulfide oxidoreductase YuxK
MSSLLIIFYLVCNVCNSAANPTKGKLQFFALQFHMAKALLQTNGRNAKNISFIVLVTEDRAFTKLDIILKYTQELKPLSLLPFKPGAVVLGRYVVPKFLRDIIYDNVADNRYQSMWKQVECRLDSDGAFENRFVDHSIACSTTRRVMNHKQDNSVTLSIS